MRASLTILCLLLPFMQVLLTILWLDYQNGAPVITNHSDKSVNFYFRYPHRHTPLGAPGVTDHSNESVNFLFSLSAQKYTCGRSCRYQP
jgi:hypothetical protein